MCRLGLPHFSALSHKRYDFRGEGGGTEHKVHLLFLSDFNIIIIFLRVLGRLTSSGIDALPSFPGASTVSSSSRFVVQGVFWESGVVHSFKVVDLVLSVFESRVLYSREL